MAKQPLPQAMSEQISRDGLSLEELAAHHGLSPDELVNQYDLGDVKFHERSGAEAQAEAQQGGEPGTTPA